MELHQLRVFAAVVRQGSITRAAEQFLIAQPAVSQTVARLEAELGVVLLNRSRQGTTPTEAGDIFYAQIVKILDDLDDVCNQLHTQKAPGGTLRLLVMAGSSLLPGLLMRFASLYPNVRYQLIQQNANIEYDLCISYAPDGIIPENGDPLFTEEVLLAVPSGHPFAKRDSVALYEAKDDDFICMRVGTPLRTMFDRMCKQAHFTPKIIYESDTPSTARSLIQLGLGLSFLPFTSWHSLIEDGVHPVHISEPICRRTLCIFPQKNRHLSSAAQAFRRVALDHFKQLTAKTQEE